MQEVEGASMKAPAPCRILIRATVAQTMGANDHVVHLCDVKGVYCDNAFLEKHLNDRVLFLELGVGAMTPMLIKEPFWAYSRQWPGGARYLAVTRDHAYVPAALAGRGLGIDADIAEFLSRLAERMPGSRAICCDSQSALLVLSA